MHIGMAVAPYVAHAKQVSDLVEVRPELRGGMRNHLLALYVLLAIPTVGAEVLAVLRAHDRDAVVSIFLRGRQLQLEFAVNVAAMCRLVVGPIQFFIIVRRLQPVHSIPKVLGLPHQALGKCLKLSRLPRLNLALRRMGANGEKSLLVFLALLLQRRVSVSALCRKAFLRRTSSLAAACGELTFRLYVPREIKRLQSRARLLKTFGWRAGDAIVGNNQIVGSTRTDSTIFSITYRLRSG